MKYAIMSDVHANPEALKAALADARDFGCERFVLCGDVTGYGYDVVGAMKLVRENFDLVLLGNHDSVCAGLEPMRECVCNPNYHLDIVQREQLAADDLGWLRQRKHLHAKNGVAFSHGDFFNPAEWGYILVDGEARRSFHARKERRMFCGHTHHAQIWKLVGPYDLSSPYKLELWIPATSPESIVIKPEKNARYIINVGSVGYPRHDLCSTYAIYDSRSHTITLRRLPFDFNHYLTQMAMRKIAIPDRLSRLLAGAPWRRVPG